MKNILSVDVEDWFQVEAQTETIAFADWHKFKMRVLPNVRHLLSIFERYDARATFFVLGWVAEKIPDLINHIASRGHEIASHGYGHQLVSKQTPEEFAADIKLANEVITKSVNVPLRGYRAPCFSLGTATPWAWKILADNGYVYDSSIFPIHHDTYGAPDMPRLPFRMELEDKRIIDEIPLTTIRLMGLNYPAAGGGYFRLLPYWFTRWAIKSMNKRGYPAVVYLHPWEIDPDQPRTRLSAISRFRHYTNLSMTIDRLERVLAEFQFGTTWEYLQEHPAGSRHQYPIGDIVRDLPEPPTRRIKPPSERESAET